MNPEEAVKPVEPTVSDLSKGELAAISEVIDLWDKLITVLGRVEARPRNCALHIDTELQPGYLGWIGYNEGGDITFQPAPAGIEVDQ